MSKGHDKATWGRRKRRREKEDRGYSFIYLLWKGFDPRKKRMQCFRAKERDALYGTGLRIDDIYTESCNNEQRFFCVSGLLLRQITALIRFDERCPEDCDQNDELQKILVDILNGVDGAVIRPDGSITVKGKILDRIKKACNNSQGATKLEND